MSAMLKPGDISRASDDDLRDMIGRGIFRRPQEMVRREAAPLTRVIWGEGDPYEDADWRPGEPPSRLVGPHQNDPTLPRAIASRRPQRIVEIGSYHGASAVRMAKAAREARSDAELLCIDPWMAVASAWVNPKKHRRMRDAFRNFKRAVVSHGLTGSITYLPTPSLEGWKVARYYGLRFDLAYIDGDHSFKACRDDLALWSQLLSVDGIMVVDDWEPGRFDGVVQAVQAFCAGSPWRYEVHGRKAVLTQ